MTERKVPATLFAEALRRTPSRALFRAVLGGAMSVYLDRSLTLPAAALPSAVDDAPDAPLTALLEAYDRRASVDEAARLAWTYLAGGGTPSELLATLVTEVLREAAGFHSFQQLEIVSRADEHAAGQLPASFSFFCTNVFAALRSFA